MIPRLCIRLEKIQLRAKPAWIVQTPGGDADNAGGPFIRFCAGESRAAVSTEAAFMLAAGQARREKVAQLPLRQKKVRRGHEQAGGNETIAAAVPSCTAEETCRAEIVSTWCRGGIGRRSRDQN